MSRAARRLNLEHLLTSPGGFGLATATPVQRAVCRVLDGLPLGELAKLEDVKRVFGGVLPSPIPPREFLLLAGIRGGKSLMSAACAVRASQIVDVSTLKAGERPRIPLLATDKDAATIVFQHLVGHLQAVPALAKLIVGEPTQETITLKHPTGRLVEIKVTALSRAGSTLVGRWLAGCIFDEAPRMQGEEEGVINLDHARRAILGRMLPGAQILYVGSPWAPFGPIYEMVQEYWAKPSESVVVCRASGRDLNPYYWTPERCAELERRKPLVYRTDVLAEFADPESALFDERAVTAAMRTTPESLPYDERVEYVATMDPATRGNAWTLTIVGCYGLGGPGGVRPMYRVAYARQWVGSAREPLKPDDVLREIARVCMSYGVDTTLTDQYSYDALATIAANHGLALRQERITQERRYELCDRLAVEITDKCFELSPDPVVRADLLGTRKRPTAGGVTVVFPRTGDGRHGDYVPALALALAFPPDPPEAPAPRLDDMGRQNEVFEMAKRIAANNDGDYWERLAARVS
jgi:hypothetical protein